MKTSGREGLDFFPLYGDWCSLDVFDYSVPKWVFCGDAHACKGAFEVFVFVSEVASYIYMCCRVEFIYKYIV